MDKEQTGKPTHADTAAEIAAALFTEIEEIKTELPQTREISIAITKLDEAILWLAKAVTEIQKNEQKEQEND